ncbi:MAG TPA: nitrate reductase molybdenum cofactor assembly chaperone [Gammaproteobacteria bacterium]|nr:nitrate reductase molybdenum cofactor assembly chaperone [Gammaproteobacteria bacterium]
MELYKALSRLLDYPEKALQEHLDEVRTLIEDSGTLSPDERRGLQALADWISMHRLIEVQALYVQTFDVTPEHSLHLTHHVFGESRERGPALVDLSEHYKAGGLDARTGELPDYLPLVLEYLSTLDDFQARLFLHGMVEVLEALAGRLEALHNPYAPVFRVLSHRGRLGNPADPAESDRAARLAGG